MLGPVAESIKKGDNDDLEHKWQSMTTHIIIVTRAMTSIMAMVIPMIMTTATDTTTIT